MRRRGDLAALLALGITFAACAPTGVGAPTRVGAPTPSGSRVLSTATLAPSVPAPASLEYGDLVRQFAYDATAPLEYREEDKQDQADGVVTYDVSYASPRGGRTEAILAVPAGAGPFAGMVFLGGLGSTKYAMRGDAIEFARIGAVGISVTQSQTRAGHPPLFSWVASDRDEIITTVLDLRRAVDILEARRDVDPARLGYEGFSHGAATGGVLAGIDHRISSYLLKSAGSLAFLAREYPQGRAGRDEYLALMATVDQIRFIPHAAPSAVFLQNGSQDAFFGLDDMRAWHATASEPKQTRFYDAGHDLTNSATEDGRQWLVDRLRLKRR